MLFPFCLNNKQNILKEEIHERQVKLDMLDGIKQELKTIENFSIESIGDIAYAMENKKKMVSLNTVEKRKEIING